MSVLLKAEGLQKRYGSFLAVQGVNFEVHAKECLALIGPNGAGKSTCFNMLNGQIPATAGDVWLDGQCITRLSPEQIWRKGVGRTFQVASTFRSFTVVENVQIALMSHHRNLNNFWRRARRQHKEEARSLLDLVGMVDQADRPCGVLAYGDSKRLELAIALANKPRLLLMDEPAAGMAPAERQSLMATVTSIIEERGISVLFTEHDMDVVFNFATRLLVLAQGELVAGGTPEEVRANKQVQEIYLGGGHA